MRNAVPSPHGKTTARLSLCLLVLALWAVGGAAHAQAPLPIRCVLVNFWQLGGKDLAAPGERRLWIKNGDFPQSLPFPMADWDLGYDPKTESLLLTIGLGDVKAAAAMTALGLDRRFDLSRAYVIVNGIAGGDPGDVSLGSVVIARHVIDHDMAYFIDPLEMPKDFPTGFLPLFRKLPYEPPPQNHGELYALNQRLAERALAAAKTVSLETDEALRGKRALYRDFPNASREPFATLGDVSAGNLFWHGALCTEKADRWARYFTNGQGEFMVSSMEDAGVLGAVRLLAKTGRVDPDRVLVARAVANHTMQWKGGAAYESLMSEGGDAYSATEAALNNLYHVVKAVMRELTR